MNWGPKSKPLVRKTGMHHARNRSAKHAKIKLVRVEDVIIPSSAREPDPKIVSFIADSIRTNKLIHPIAVRYEFDSLRRTSKKTLVAGGNRLAASRMLGEEFIPCTFVEDDDTVVRLVQISENLFRKDLTALERAEQYAEWARITEQQEVSGQNVRKRKGGRPEGGSAKLGRMLPISGKTEEARRKTIDRSKAIDSIFPDVKAAAKAAKLDKSQQALLKIAKQMTPHAQLKKVRELGTTRTPKRVAIKRRLRETMPISATKIYKGLLAEWDSWTNFRKLWHHAPTEIRERFINEVLRGPHDGGLEEAAELVRKAFHGRQSILVQDMQRLGHRYGFKKKIIQKVIRELGYKKKRLHWDRNRPWSYMNTYKDWKDELRVIPNEKFADLRPPEKRQTKAIVADVDIDKDDDSELPERAPDPDFSDLDWGPVR